MLGSLDRTGTDQHGAARVHRLGNGFDHRVPFELCSPKYACARICPLQGFVRGDAHDAEAVGAVEFSRWLDRRSGHAAKMPIAPKEPLVGHLSKRLAPLRDGAMFLSFDELMNSAFPGTVGHDAPGIFVDDLHFTVGNYILNIAPIQVKSGKRMLHEFFASAPYRPQTRQTGSEECDLTFAASS